MGRKAGEDAGSTFCHGQGEYTFSDLAILKRTF
jgi:hypothetical protein